MSHGFAATRDGAHRPSRPTVWIRDSLLQSKHMPRDSSGYKNIGDCCTEDANGCTRKVG